MAAPPHGTVSVLGFAFKEQARQCIRPYRVHHFLNYGLVVRFQLLPTPPLGDAVAFSYGQTSASVRLGLSPNCWCALSGALLDRVPRSCSHGPLSLGYKAIASLLRFRPKILQTFFRRAGPLWDRARLRAQDLHISANARRS